MSQLVFPVPCSQLLTAFFMLPEKSVKSITSAFPYASRERHIEILGNKYEGLLTFNNMSESRGWSYTDESVSEERTFTWTVDSLNKSFKVQIETGVYNPPN